MSVGSVLSKQTKTKSKQTTTKRRGRLCSLESCLEPKESWIDSIAQKALTLDKSLFAKALSLKEFHGLFFPKSISNNSYPETISPTYCHPPAPYLICWRPQGREFDLKYKGVCTGIWIYYIMNHC